MLTDEEIRALRNRIERESPLNGHLHITGATRLVREAEAATLATVTPLVQAARAQALQEAHDAMFDIKGDKITRFDAQTAIRKLGQTAGGATKESTDA